MKKILALAIAVIMICACTVSAFAAEKPLADVDSPAFWGAHSEGIEITAEGVDISFLSTSYAEAASNWEGPMYILYTADEAKVNGAGYVEYWVQRGDNWGWNSTANTGDMAALNAMGVTMVGTCDNWDALWANYVANCKAGCEVKIHAALEDGKAVVTMELQGLKMVTSVPVPADKTVYLSLSGEKAKLTGIKVITPDPAAEVPEGISAPVAGTTYNFGLYQGNTNKVVYVTGEVSTRYLSTTENVEEAAAVYVEAVDGGYKFFILVDGVKNYITVYNNDEGKLSVKYDAAGTSVYTYNAECNNWVTTMEGADYYLGTYNNFETVSASKVSYIKPDNTGISQFPANLYVAPVQQPLPTEPIAPSEPADPITPPTGDPIGVVVALLAISGTALVVLKKKEN